MSKKIPLSKGKYAIVDDEDYEWLSQWKWYANNVSSSRERDRWYAGRNRNYGPPGNRKQKRVMMHRVIMEPPGDMVVDHINHNGLDNRRANLRVCTRTQNARNTRPIKGRKYKGAISCENGWKATVMVNDRQWISKVYYTKEDAARAYDRKAMEIQGEFACLNFDDNDTFDWEMFDKRVRKERKRRPPSGRHQADHSRQRKSKYRGVLSRGKAGGYRVKIYKDKKLHYGGVYKDELEAARAYDKLAQEVYGEDAVLNFP